MCGRFFEDLSEDEITAYFGAEPSEAVRHEALAPRYNVAPGQSIWVVRSDPKTQQRSLDSLHWGLIPHFASDKKGAYRCINARAETIDRVGMYRAAFAKRRCLVVARGFYEWRREGKHKQPFAIAAPDGSPLALAGVWENWLDKESGEWLRSVAIVTTEANAGVRPLHDRMPVIVSPEDYARWLGEQPAAPEELKALLRPDARELRIWPVSPRVNRAESDDPALLEPVTPAGVQGELAGVQSTTSATTKPPDAAG